MDSQAKRTLIATGLCLAIMVGWMKFMSVFYPPPAPRATGATASAPASDVDERGVARDGPVSDAADDAGARGAGSAERAITHGAYHAVDAGDDASITLGDSRHDNAAENFRNPYEMEVVITPKGAAVQTVRLSRFLQSVRRGKKDVEPDPYTLLRPFEDLASGLSYYSFAVEKLNVIDEKTNVELEDVRWRLARREDDGKGQTAEFETIVRKGAEDLFRLRRTYHLAVGASHLEMALVIENLTRATHRASVGVRGPVGVSKDDLRMDYRRIASAVVGDDGLVEAGDVAARGDVHKRMAEGGQELLPGEGEHLLWASLSSKYFSCIVTALPSSGASSMYAPYLAKIVGRTLTQGADAADDMTFDQVLVTGSLAGGATATFDMEAYCGPKSQQVFESVPAAVQRYYEITRYADKSPCTFQWLASAMLWLLTFFYRFTHNYGVAIILLVIVVRTLLHPITKRGQTHIMKMQKSMAALKPKIDAIQEQCKNDRQKLSEETMKLYREEGVNPAGQMLGCLPMFLQMPIWVALWTALNTNVDMRHEPFCLWMRDLAGPDAMFTFSRAFDVPLLSYMMGPITAFNLLPIIMTITMYAQQKFMQKLTRPAVPPPPKLDEHGHPLPDPMAQQQKIMSFMMIFFGFLFYNFPSGLNIYILTSNILGMAEQVWIKKQIREKEERGEFSAAAVKRGPKPAGGRPSLFERLSQRAEAARQIQSSRPAAPAKKKRKKQPRF
jgi:YidC/Oxa1 family membrane protein insertase